MQSALTSRPVVFRSPFDAVDDGNPSKLVSQTQTALWDPHDEAIRRFLKSAPNANRQQLAAHITSATTAYAKAFLSIRQSVKNADVKALLESCTENDTAETAMDIYAAQGASLDKGHISKFVDILHHYHGVFDVLSQTESCLTLLWGGMKLILMVSLRPTWFPMGACADPEGLYVDDEKPQ
jgi:hypothetical protein